MVKVKAKVGSLPADLYEVNMKKIPSTGDLVKIRSNDGPWIRVKVIKALVVHGAVLYLMEVVGG